MPFKPVPVTEELLQQAVRMIVNEAEPEMIFLFGSHARGDARPDSDLDLIVVESAPFGKERSRRLEAVRLYHALRGLGVPKDVLVFTTAEVEYWRDSLNHVLARALREGRVLYERSQVRACTSLAS